LLIAFERFDGLRAVVAAEVNLHARNVDRVLRLALGAADRALHLLGVLGLGELEVGLGGVLLGIGFKLLRAVVAAEVHFAALIGDARSLFRRSARNGALYALQVDFFF